MTTVANSADDILLRFRMVYTKKMDIYDADAKAPLSEARSNYFLYSPPVGYLDVVWRGSGRDHAG